MQMPKQQQVQQQRHSKHREMREEAAAAEVRLGLSPPYSSASEEGLPPATVAEEAAAEEASGEVDEEDEDEAGVGEEAPPQASAETGRSASFGSVSVSAGAAAHVPPQQPPPQQQQQHRRRRRRQGRGGRGAGGKWNALVSLSSMLMNFPPTSAFHSATKNMLRSQLAPIAPIAPKAVADLGFPVHLIEWGTSTLLALCASIHHHCCQMSAMLVGALFTTLAAMLTPTDDLDWSAAKW